jgi:hypothetical protein
LIDEDPRAFGPEKSLQWLVDAGRLLPQCGFAWLVVSFAVLTVAVLASSSKLAQLALISWVVLAGSAVATFAMQKGALNAGDSLWVLLQDALPAAAAASLLSLIAWALSGFSLAFAYNGTGVPYIPFSSDVIAWHRAFLPLAVPSLYVVTLLTLTVPTSYLIVRRLSRPAQRACFKAALQAVSPTVIAAGLAAAVVLFGGLLASVFLPVALGWMSCLIAVMFNAQRAGAVQPYH